MRCEPLSWAWQPLYTTAAAKRLRSHLCASNRHSVTLAGSLPLRGENFRNYKNGPDFGAVSGSIVSAIVNAET